MAAMPKLEGVNLDNSTNITLTGLLILARSESIQELSLSCGKLTQDDQIEIINAAHHVNRIDISEPPGGRLDATTLRKAAEAKRITFYVVHNMVCSRLWHAFMIAAPKLRPNKAARTKSIQPTPISVFG